MRKQVRFVLWWFLIVGVVFGRGYATRSAQAALPVRYTGVNLADRESGEGWLPGTDKPMISTRLGREPSISAAR
jgi:hypothetical protein